MTLINNLFLYYNLKATFLQNYIVHSDNTYTDMSGSSVASVPDSATVIKYDAIAFIKDSNEIWTHGIFYASTDPEILQRISNVEGKVTTLEGIDHTQYATKSWVNDQGFLKDSDIPGSPDLTSYLKKSEAESLYLPKEDFEWYEEE